MKRIILCVAVLVHLAAPAAFAQGVGAIGGTISDSSGAVLPGVNVSLVSPGVIGGNQQTVTDERGAYQFLRLVPATYSVRGELQGFRTTTRENITVNADATARVDFALAVGNLEEGITVSGEAPLLDTTSALNQTVVDRTLLAALPSRNDLWSIGRAVPSVVMNKYDVGGTESVREFVGHGARRKRSDRRAVHGRRHGRGLRFGGWHDVQLRRSVRLPGNQLPDWQRLGGEHEGRDHLQHDHANRNERVPWRVTCTPGF